MILFSLITLNYTHIAYIIIEFNYFEKREREREKEREIQEFWRIEGDWEGEFWEGEFWEVGVATHVGKGSLKKWEQNIFKANFEAFEKGEGRSQKIFFQEDSGAIVEKEKGWLS